MTRARRTDNNLGAIVKALRKMGWRVYVNNNALCDLVIQRGTKTLLVEVKDKRGTFTPAQKKMREQGWEIRTIRTIEDCVI